MTDALRRYSRQTVLPEVGVAGQRKLAQASVLVVGVGGLGLPAAAYLAGAGVGTITLVDHDTVDLHNLHRQVIYRECDVGRSKVAAAANHLRQLNSNIAVVEVAARLSQANVEALVAGHDLVIDAADNFATTYMLSDTCKQLGKPLICASILGNKGYLGVFCANAPSYRALFPSAPEDAATCNGAGVLGPAVGVVGLMQAQEAIKLIVMPAKALTGKLLTVDLWQHRYSVMDFSTAPEPVETNPVPVLSGEHLRADDLLVDVRTLEEIAHNPVHGAFHLPAESGEYLFDRLPFCTGRTVFFCVTGTRALSAARLFSDREPGRQVGVWLRNEVESV